MTVVIHQLLQNNPFIPFLLVLTVDEKRQKTVLTAQMESPEKSCSGVHNVQKSHLQLQILEHFFLVHFLLLILGLVAVYASYPRSLPRSNSSQFLRGFQAK